METITLPNDKKERIQMLKKLLAKEVSSGLIDKAEQIMKNFFNDSDTVELFDKLNVPYPSYAKIVTDEEYNDEDYDLKITHVAFYDEDMKRIDYENYSHEKVYTRWNGEVSTYDETIDDIIREFMIGQLRDALDVIEFDKYCDDYVFNIKE